jgi:glycosyltransferase involved in cell wall biosynthesis
MKINFVLGNDLKKFGGIQRHVTSLRQHLEEKGTKVLVLGKSDKDFIFAGKAIPGLKKILRYFRSIETFHFFGFTCFYVAFFLKLVSKDAKIVYTPCMHPFATHRHPILAKIFFSIFLKPSLKKIDKLIVLSKYEFDFFKDFLDEDVITIIPSGIENVGDIPIGITSGDYFLFVGRDDENKRLFLLERLAEIVQDLNFVFVTNKRKPNRSNVTYLNGVSDEDLKAVYSKATATIVPSKYESFSIVALESLANGTPIIITENVQIKSFLCQSIMTIVYENDVLNNLERAVRDIAEKTANDIDIRRTSIEAAKGFLWLEIADEHVNIYCNLVKK